jgi:hypothetical protein
MVKTYQIEMEVDLGNRFIPLGKDFIDSKINFSCKGVDFSIIFPAFDKQKPFWKPGLPKLNWGSNRDDKLYGFFQSRETEKDDTTKFFCYKLVVIVQGSHSKYRADKISTHVEKLIPLFLDFLEIVSRRDLSSEGVTVKNERICPATVFGFSSDKPSAVKLFNNVGISMAIDISAQEKVSKKDFMKALKLACDEAQIPIYYNLLLSAHRQLNDELFRQSVLDSATAMETALVEYLDRILAHKKTDQTTKELIFQQYKQIHGLCSAIKQYEPSFDQNKYESRVAKPRNLAIHNGTNITEQEAKDTYSIVKQFIYDNLSI